MTNNFNKISKDLKAAQAFIKTKLPTIIGVEAVNHFSDNFQREGFDNQKWKKSKRIGKAKGAAGTRHTLTGDTGDLGRSLSYKVSGNKINISSDKPYAKIHNEGGRVRALQNVRPHKRTINGKTHNVKANSRKLDFQMPKRQFVGNSSSLKNKLEKQLLNRFQKIFK